MGIDRKKTRNAAQKQLRKGNWRKALEHYEKLADDDEKDVRSRLKIADLHSRLDDHEAAVQAYQEVGDYHAGQDIYQKAVAVYKQALRIKPEDGDLQKKLAEAYHRLGRLRDATQAFSRALKAYKRDDDLDRQIEILEQLVRLDPEQIGFRIQLAENYAKVSQRDEALESFRKAAEFLYEEGRNGDYTQVAERIIYFDPEDTATRKRLIRQYIDRDDYKRALKHLRVCFNANPQDVEILRLLGHTFVELDRRDKALMVYRRLAEQYQARDQIQDARDTWETILEMNPEDSTARKALKKLEAAEQSSPEPTPEPAEASTEPPPPTPEADGDGQPDDVVDLSDSLVPLDDESSQPANDAETGDAPATAAERARAELQADEQEQEAESELAQTLNEADVFIKYGLYDQAREVIQKLARMAPEDLRVFERRRHLYNALDETRAEVQTLLRMAELTADTPERAESYLDAARDVTDNPDRVREKAEELGLAKDRPPETPAEAGAESDDSLGDLELEPVDDLQEQQQQEATADSGFESSGEMMDLEDLDVELLDADAPEQDGAQPPPGSDSTEQDDARADQQLGAEESEGEFVDLNSAEGLDFDFDEDAVDDLFSGIQDDDDEETVNLGSDDPSGDMAEIDFYIQQGLYDDAEEALETFAEANPDHPGIDKRRYQIQTARQGGKVEENPSGAESLSEQSIAEGEVDSESDDDEAIEGPDGFELDDIENTNLEVGTAYREMGLYDEAIEEFQRALDDPDAAPRARFNIAVCKAELGETDIAADALDNLANDGELPGELRSAAQQKLREIDARPAE